MRKDRVGFFSFLQIQGAALEVRLTYNAKDGPFYKASFIPFHNFGVTMEKTQKTEHNLTILSTILLLSSIIYDYSYYLKIGFELKQLPIFATDSFHTIIGSVPLIAIILFMNFLSELFYMRTERGETAEELIQKIKSSKHPKFNMILNFGYNNIVRWIFISIPILYEASAKVLI